jgi:hypothetical protein
MIKSVSGWTCSGFGLETHITMIFSSSIQFMAKGKKNSESRNITALIIKTRYRTF